MTRSHDPEKQCGTTTYNRKLTGVQSSKREGGTSDAPDDHYAHHDRRRCILVFVDNAVFFCISPANGSALFQGHMFVIAIMNFGV